MYNTVVAYLLWLFSGFGALGFHRFYLGKIPTGLLWMFTGGMAMIGSIYDFITLPNQVREANIRKAIYDTSLRQALNPTTFTSNMSPMRDVTDGQARIVREKEPVERIILRIAKENKGILTASELALSANIPVEEAKNNLEAMVSKGFAELRVRQSGTLVYAIPDLMESNDPLLEI